MAGNEIIRQLFDLPRRLKQGGHNVNVREYVNAVAPKADGFNSPNPLDLLDQLTRGTAGENVEGIGSTQYLDAMNPGGRNPFADDEWMAMESMGMGRSGPDEMDRVLIDIMDKYKLPVMLSPARYQSVLREPENDLMVKEFADALGFNTQGYEDFDAAQMRNLIDEISNILASLQ